MPDANLQPPLFTVFELLLTVAQPGGVKGVRSHPSLILGAHRRFELQHYAA